MLQNYVMDEWGVVHQITCEPFTYDVNYVHDRYLKIRSQAEQISQLRLGFQIGCMGEIPQSVLDVGYGEGDFLNACARLGIQTYGCDLFPDLIPDHAQFVAHPTQGAYDLITFFDSLEHFPCLDFVKHLRAKFVGISVPWCHHPEQAEWFQNWKHRRPHEHLHHFNLSSLTRFMHAQGFHIIHHAHVEDGIRSSMCSTEPNILSAVFKKQS